MTIKYGFNWNREADGSFTGIHCQNKRYAIAAIQDKGIWSYELLTNQKCSLTGRHSYEPPQRQSSAYSTKDISKIVQVINGRVIYWQQQEQKKILCRL